VIVTTPQDIALIDARKGLKMFEKVGVPIVGVVENMAIHICSNCGHAEHIFGEGGGEKMCRDYNVPFLGALPLDIRIREQATRDARRSSPTRRQGRAEISGDRAQGRDLRRAEGGDFSASSRASSSRTHDQIRQVDPPHGGSHNDDRAVRARAGPRVNGTDRFVRHVELRLRHPLLERIQDLHQHQLDDRRSRRRSTPARSSISAATSASSRRTRSRSLAPSSTSAFPRNVLTICLGKARTARCGIIVNVTPFEPEWEGYVTLEFSNTTPLPGEDLRERGVAQVIFFESDEVCETSYKDRGGKYQGQQGVTLPKI
jgi:hypothetical protein